jgi:hypothetical protein
LTVGADAPQAHYLLEDIRGNRLADFHKTLGNAVSLLRPASAGTLFLRRVSDRREFEISAIPDVVRLDDLISSPARAAKRGAAQHAFSLIFSLPYDKSTVAAYQLPSRDEYFTDKSSGQTSRPTWRSVSGVSALVVAAGAGVAGGILVVGSRTAAREAEAAPTQARADALNQRVISRNRGAAVALGVGGVAALVGGLLLFWPEADGPRPVAQVDRGGAWLGFGGVF